MFTKVQLVELQAKALAGRAISDNEAFRLFNLGWNLNANDLMDIAKNTSNLRSGKTINFYYPTPCFPTVSITANNCFLNCKHCQKKLLVGMTPATTPEKLVEICEGLARAGAKGILITGGCLPNGGLPLSEFADAIHELKRTTNLVLIAHTGIITFDDAKNFQTPS